MKNSSHENCSLNKKKKLVPHLRLELEEPLLTGLALRLASLGLLSHPSQLPAHLVASAVPRGPFRVHPLLLELQEALVAPGIPDTTSEARPRIS